MRSKNLLPTTRRRLEASCRLGNPVMVMNRNVRKCRDKNRILSPMVPMGGCGAQTEEGTQRRGRRRQLVHRLGGTNDRSIPPDRHFFFFRLCIRISMACLRGTCVTIDDDWWISNRPHADDRRQRDIPMAALKTPKTPLKKIDAAVMGCQSVC